MRDHALSLHRFVGVVEVLGGLTLVAAYALGAEALRAPNAAGALVVLGVLQVIVGVVWLVRATALQRIAARRPGVLVATMLVPATLVVALGGSNLDSLWVTSAQAWMVAAGVSLPGWRILAATAGSAAAAAAVWVAVDGSSGGFGADGHYALAVVAMAKVVFVGLWIGQLVGATWNLLSRWHVIEVHERGLVERLRTQLERVDEAAARVADQLGAARVSAAAEVDALRVRLARGVRHGLGGTGDPASRAPLTLAHVLDELRSGYEAQGTAPQLRIEVDPAVAARTVGPVVADVLVTVARRQLGNVVRHAPNATYAAVQLAADDAGALRLTITDDGAGRVPRHAAPGTGTAWSERQLARVNGTTRLFDAPAGVGFEVCLPAAGPHAIGEADELSIDRGLTRFADGTMFALRIAGYLGDTFGAMALDGIGDRWLLMPLGALLIECALRFGLPGAGLGHRGRAILAGALSVALVAVFTVPADSPDQLVPATTSVVIPAMVLLDRQRLLWLALELARTVAVLPLLTRHGASAVELVVVYPLLFSGMVLALERFLARARGLERDLLDAVGRAALAGAAIRGLSLRHDAVDVLLRTAPDDPGLIDAGADLEDAIHDLDALVAASVDPREVVLEALAASSAVPTVRASGTPAGGAPVATAGALDRLALLEVAALAADERASCTPPGWFGRRRLRALAVAWEHDDDGNPAAVFTAVPQLGPPDPVKVRALAGVARTAGLRAESAATGLRLSTLPR